MWTEGLDQLDLHYLMQEEQGAAMNDQVEIERSYYSQQQHCEPLDPH